MKNVDVTKVDPGELVDIREVEIDTNRKQANRLADFIRQIKNPYCYRYGEYIVKIAFDDTSITLAERLREMIARAAGSTDY